MIVGLTVCRVLQYDFNHTFLYSIKINKFINFNLDSYIILKVFFVYFLLHVYFQCYLISFEACATDNHILIINNLVHYVHEQ